MVVSFISAMVKPGSGAKHLRKRSSWTEQVWEIYERVTGQKRLPMFEPREPDAEG